MDKDKTPSPAQSLIDISPEMQNHLTTISELYVKTSVEVIIIAIDKVKLCLIDHLGRLEKKGRWITPLALLIMFLLTFATAEFEKEAFGLSGDNWFTVFLILAVGSAIWLVIAVVVACNTETTDDIIAELKKEAMKIPLDK